MTRRRSAARATGGTALQPEPGGPTQPGHGRSGPESGGQLERTFTYPAGI